ncbi:50S ribosomal protein L18e [Candidatus Woesearchaeota archaeon]|nr:50S ribosomal protein L18e [Candidatus Woesearchaeota archaeon]
MAIRTGPTNPIMQSLIQELRKTSSEQKIPLWDRIADDLEKPTRQRRAVNLSKINRFTEENEMIIVPGKVLGSGALSHKLTIAAFSFSAGALEKISKVQAKAISIKELMQQPIKDKRVRILG